MVSSVLETQMPHLHGPLLNLNMRKCLRTFYTTLCQD